jgi:enoyl-CoA hydratase
MSVELKNILFEKRGPIVVLTFNRPQALNALNEETLQDLLRACRQIREDREVRAVILTGAGGKAFVAGADIKAMGEMAPLDALRFARLGHRAFAMLEKLDPVVIAAVDGYALGGGCELILCCDLILATPESRFGQPEVNLGIIPGFGGTQRLGRLMGRNRAKDLIFTGRQITAPEAYEYGLVQKIVSKEELMKEALRWADQVLSKGPVAIELSKKAINNGMETGLPAGCELERNAFAAVFATEDRKEGIQAFLEKRKPNFRGK